MMCVSVCASVSVSAFKEHLCDAVQNARSSCTAETLSVFSDMSEYHLRKAAADETVREQVLTLVQGLLSVRKRKKQR